MTLGTVKWFNRKRGFGFIEPDEGDKDTFVHISAVKRAGWLSLDEGQRVSYELKPLDDGRLMAEDLQSAGDAGDIGVTDGTADVIDETDLLEATEQPQSLDTEISGVAN